MAKVKFYYGWYVSFGKLYDQMWSDEIDTHIELILIREITVVEFGMTLLDMEVRYPKQFVDGRWKWSDGHPNNVTSK